MSYNTSFFGGGSGGGSGVTTFTGLTDTPASYSGQAGKVVKVNSAENALEFVDGAGGATPIDSAYENVAAMVAATDISNGDNIATYGYYSLSDGGQMVYTVTNTDLSGDVDGGSVIALANSLYAQAQFPNYYSPEMWGAKGNSNNADASTNVTAFQAMWDYIGNTNSHIVLYSQGGSYRLNDTVTLPASTADYLIDGNNATLTLVNRGSSATDAHRFTTGSKTFNVVSGLNIQAGDTVVARRNLDNYLQGTVTSYSGTTLVANITSVNRLIQNITLETTSSTTSQTIGLGSMTFTVDYNLFLDTTTPSELRIQYDASNYMIADVTSYSQNSLVVNVTSVVGSGTYSTWTIGNNVDLRTGSAVFSVGNTYNFQSGMIVRVSIDASNYMEGEVTAYNAQATPTTRPNGILTVNITSVTGSGSALGGTVDLVEEDDWYVSVPTIIWDRSVTSTAQAGNAVEGKLVINNLNFSGGGINSEHIALKASGSYNSHYSNMEISGFKIGIYGLFNLMWSLESIRFGFCSQGLTGTFGDWAGANSANSASNVVITKNIRYCSGSPYSAAWGIAQIGSNGWKHYNYIHECGASRYAFYYDSQGSTTHDLTVDGCHVEATCWDSLVYQFNNNGAEVTINDLFIQYYNALVRSTTSSKFKFGLVYSFAMPYFLNHPNCNLEVDGAGLDGREFALAETFPNWDLDYANLGNIRVGNSYLGGETIRLNGTFSIGQLLNNGTNPRAISFTPSAGNKVSIYGGGLQIPVDGGLLLNGPNNPNIIYFTRDNFELRASPSAGGVFRVSKAAYISFYGSGIQMEGGLQMNNTSLITFRSPRSSGWIAANTANALGLNITNNSVGTTRTRLYATNAGSSLTAAETHEDGGMLFYGPLKFDGGYEQTNTDGSAGQVLKTDGAGSANWADITSSDIGTYSDVAAMVAATNYASGDLIQTQGYYEANDGGQMVYTVTNTDLSASVDGGSVIDLGSGLYAQANFPNYYRPEMWGAKGDNSTASADINVTALQAMFDYAKIVANNRPIKFSRATYYINESIIMYDPEAGNLCTGEYFIDGNYANIRSIGRKDTTATSLSFSVGSKTMTVRDDKRYKAGERIKIVYPYGSSGGGRGNWMEGTVTSYSSTTLVVDVTTLNYHQINRLTSLRLETGSKTISAVNNGGSHAFGVGMDVTCVYGDNAPMSMSGAVTSVSGNNVTIDFSAVSTITGTCTSNEQIKAVGTEDFFNSISADNLPAGEDLESIPVGTKVRFTSVDTPTDFVEGYLLLASNAYNWLKFQVTALNGLGNSYDNWTWAIVEVPRFNMAVTSIPNFVDGEVNGGITMLSRPNNPYTAGSVEAKPTIKRFTFTGETSYGEDIGLEWTASYGGLFTEMEFGNLCVGFQGEFNLMGSVRDMRFSSLYGFKIGSANFTSSATQSNVHDVVNMRYYGPPCGGKAGFYIFRSNSFRMKNIIVEGGGAEYGVLWDDDGSTTAAEVSIEGLHNETGNKLAIVGTNAIVTNVEDLYSQFVNIMFDQTRGNYNGTIGLSAWWYKNGSLLLKGNANITSIGSGNLWDTASATQNPSNYHWDITGYNSSWSGWDLGTSVWTPSTIERSVSFGFDTSLSRLILGSSTQLLPGGQICNIGSTSARTKLIGSTGELAFGDGSYYTRLKHTGTSFGLQIISTSRGISLITESSSQAVDIQSNYLVLAQYDNTRKKIIDTTGEVTEVGQLFLYQGNDVNGVPKLEVGKLDFLELGDVTDSSYTGLAGAIPTVNAAETGMELVSPADTGEVIKSTATGAAYGNVFGQIVSLTYDTATATVSIPTGGGLRPLTYSINFKATATAMFIELQCYVAIAAGETITAGLSDNSSTFNDVGTTALGLATNGAIGATTLSVVKTWYVTGLTVGNAYTWYPSVESTGASSTIRVGVGVSPFVIKAIHGAV